MKLTSLEGVFRNGRVELSEPLQAREETRVIVTFLPELRGVSLPAQGIDAEEAADLRARLHSFAEDWDRPDMDVYNAL